LARQLQYSGVRNHGNKVTGLSELIFSSSSMKRCRLIF
jgi:hypothetical protein